MREQMHRQPQHDSESADEPPLPREWLTIERLDQMRKMAFLTGKVFWDLELHQPTPDLDAFETLLGERYGYYTDDVPHAPLFGQKSTRFCRQFYIICIIEPGLWIHRSSLCKEPRNSRTNCGQRNRPHVLDISWSR